MEDIQHRRYYSVQLTVLNLIALLDATSFNINHGRYTRRYYSVQQTRTVLNLIGLDATSFNINHGRYTT